MTTTAAPVFTPTRGAVGADLLFDPLCRTGGNVGFRVRADAASGRYTGARVASRFFRGYENILVGRDVRDSVFLSSRVCGYHGGQHSIAAAQAVEMALNLDPMPMGVAIRNLGMSAETIHAEAAHLVLLVAPDLSENQVKAHWPDLWSVAERTPSPHAEVHRYRTIADIMRSFNCPDGRWYQDAFKVARIPYQMYAVLHGKYPHPETIVPGGVASNITHTTTSKVHDYVVRLLSLVDPAKRVVKLLDDLFDFCLATVPEIGEIGVGPANLIDSGQWDDAEGYDTSWEALTERGNRRWASPGVILDGRLVTSDLRQVTEGIEESVPNSLYNPWSGGADPFSKRTSAIKANGLWDDRYSWATSVRWKGNVVETGPGARLWTTALRGTMRENNFLAVQNNTVYMLLPSGPGEGELPPMVLEWTPPPVWNAIERNRARLYSIVFAALMAANMSFATLDHQKFNNAETSYGPKFIDRAKGERRGVGFSGDGLLGHWLSTEGKMISNYQIVAPSTINIGPGGAAEQGVDGTPIIDRQEPLRGAEAQVALRSFDPCANCASH